MATLRFHFHTAATADIAALASSAKAAERTAAQQVVALLNLVQGHAALWNRLQSHYENMWVTNNGVSRQVDIRILESLKDIAWDDKYHTDAIRRLKDPITTPLNEYRIFFAPVPSRGGGFDFKVLGVFPRKIAYENKTLAILKKRYES